MHRIFVLVPSLHPTGPVKGAVALANVLVQHRPVALVALKPGPGIGAPVDKRIEQISLVEHPRLRDKVRHYRLLLAQAGGRANVVSISFCLSADVVNLCCRREAVICSSVRGNLPMNYRLDYGVLGFGAAALHLFLLRWFDHAVAMTASMARQIARFRGTVPVVVGNFVDEAALEPFRRERLTSGPYRYVFVGSLSVRKCPQILLEAATELKRRRLQFRLAVVGSGPLLGLLESKIEELGLSDAVTLHGQVSEPYGLIAAADCLVLPSLSEGVSRAVLEALYLGVPCVVRDVDGSGEVVRPGVNGMLFRDDGELADAMIRTAEWARERLTTSENLLPAHCRQADGAARYLSLVEEAR